MEKFYESEDDYDVEYILSDYYDANKANVKILKPFKLYEFNNFSEYRLAIKDLNNHELKYKSTFSNYRGYIIIFINNNIIEFFDNYFSKLTAIKNGLDIFYVDPISHKKTRTLYKDDMSCLFIDSFLVEDICNKFSVNRGILKETLLLWYVKNKLHKKCSAVYNNSIDLVM